MTHTCQAAIGLYNRYTHHAFNNDPSERYNKPAANQAWGQTLAFFDAYLR